MSPLPSWLKTILVLTIVCLAMITGARAQHSIVLTSMEASESGELSELASATPIRTNVSDDVSIADTSKTDHTDVSWDDDWGEPYLSQIPRLPVPHLSARARLLRGLAPSSTCLRSPLRPPESPAD